MTDKRNTRPTELEEIQIEAAQVADDSLQSTRRMLNLLEESEEAGQKTLEALNEQGEQLNRIEQGMDNINADMNKAQRSLNRLKRCCITCPTAWKKVPTEAESIDGVKNQTGENTKVIVDQPRRIYDEKRGNDGTSVNPTTGYITRITNDAREDEMDQNLCQVNNILGNLRNMAEDMNSELSQQNDQIVRITAKGDDNSVRLDQVNSTANKMINS